MRVDDYDIPIKKLIKLNYFENWKYWEVFSSATKANSVEVVEEVQKMWKTISLTLVVML